MRLWPFLLGLGACCLLLRGEHVRACSGGFDPPFPYAVFDQGLLGDPDLSPAFYDADHAGYGGYEPSMGEGAILAEWHGYLAGAVPDDAWKQILFSASADDTAALARRLATGQGQLPRGFERSALWAAPAAARPRLAAALAVIRLAHQIEPSASLGGPFTVEPPPPGQPLLAAATAGMASADRFLAQRYAFQAVRVLFYQRAFPAVIQFVEQHGGELAGPSPGLGWRARYYLAGALLRTGQTARGDLELAHVSVNYPPLTGAAAGDFTPAATTAGAPRSTSRPTRATGPSCGGSPACATTGSRRSARS
ncbi:MAG TPA: hypothetical protein VGC42_14035 [Kofleriaceae bacterium]